MRRIASPWIASIVCLAAAGCASTPPATADADFQVTDDQYEVAFAAAKDVLRDAGFALDRVDATRGVITTRERSSSGFATPWIDHATTPGDGAAGVLHRERRIAEVRFVRESGGPDAPIRAEVEVTIQRIGAPGRQPEPSSIRIQSQWTEGTRSGASSSPFSAITERPDPRLAARLASQIEDRVAHTPPALGG